MTTMMTQKLSLSAVFLVAGFFFSPALVHASFSDVSISDPHQTAIGYMQETGIISGYPDGTFRPDQTINRAEFTKIVTGMLYTKNTIDSCSTAHFSDSTQGAWYEPYVCTAQKEQLVNGYPDGSFRPDASINFAEAAKILVRGLHLPHVSDNGPWYQEYIKELADQKAIPTSISAIDQILKRGEFAEMAYRVRAGITDQPSRGYNDLTSVSQTNQIQTTQQSQSFHNALPSQNTSFTDSGTVLLLVDQNVLPSLTDELKNWSDDVRRELGVKTQIKAVSSSDDIRTLRDYVTSVYNQTSLKGVLLVGNVPTASFYLAGSDPLSVLGMSEGLRLNDGIYKDIFGICQYSEDKKAFLTNPHNNCDGNFLSEPYWVGRLTPNSSKHSDIELLKAYFQRNHAYRNGLLTFQQKALLYNPIYVDPSYNNPTSLKIEQDSIVNDLHTFDDYPEGRYTSIDYTAQDADKQFMDEASKGYEMLQYNGHGAPTFLDKNMTTPLPFTPSFFYADFRSCSVGRFTTKDYIAGDYLFGGGLIVKAASVPIWSTSQFESSFLHGLQSGLPFYSATIDNNNQAMNVLGDPTLRMRYGQNAINNNATVHFSDDHIDLSTDQPATLSIVNRGTTPFRFKTLPEFYPNKNNELFLNILNVTNAHCWFDNTTYDPNDFAFEILQPYSTATMICQESDYTFPKKGLPSGIYPEELSIISNDHDQPVKTIRINHFVP